MMSCIRLVSYRCHTASFPPSGYNIQISCQLSVLATVSHVASQCNADHKRHIPLPCQPVQIADCHHDIILLIRRNRIRDKIKFPQISFCLFQFYDCDLGKRRRPDKIIFHILASTCHPGHKGSMSIGIHGRNGFQRIFCPECGIDLLCLILGTICDPLRLCSIPDRLIPDAVNPCCPIRILKYRISVIDPGIDKSDHHALPFQCECRLLL